MNNITFKKDLLGVQDDLLRFAYKLTSDREEANDLLQETSLKALDNEEKYTPDTNFKGWMYTIMRNIFINNYRKVVRDQTFVDTTDNLYHLNLPRDAAFESTESAYDLKEMHRIVNALPREYKIPFSMHVSGFKYREIAEKLGLSLLQEANPSKTNAPDNNRCTVIFFFMFIIPNSLKSVFMLFIFFRKFYFHVVFIST